MKLDLESARERIHSLEQELDDIQQVDAEGLGRLSQDLSLAKSELAQSPRGPSDPPAPSGTGGAVAAGAGLSAVNALRTEATEIKPKIVALEM